MEIKLPFEKTKREILLKKQAETSDKYGINPEKIPVKELIEYGVVNLNKPKGPTSHEISAFVQKVLGIKKSGHSGSLDPGVTGVLPVALGRGTRIVQALLKAGKEYICIIHFHKDVSEDDIKKVFKEFTGKIKQIPPLKSAVKRQEREREVYYIEIMEINKKDVLFKTGVEAGTYIRKLCFDIGKKLGCGAHMAELIRTKAGPFSLKDSVTLQDLADALWYYKNEDNEKLIRHCIQPVETAVEHLPKMWVFDSTVNPLCHGVDLKLPGISKLESGIEKDDIIAVMSLKDELIGIGVAKMNSEKMLKEEKGLAVEIHKVFMKDNAYS